MPSGWKTRIVVCAALAGSLWVLSATPARAHHSTAMFDLAHPITISGVVTRLEWTNPHSYIYLNVADAKGAVHEWAIETSSPSFLEHNGWTRTSLSPGDRITCTGARARAGGYFLHATMIQLPNGLQLRS